MKQWDGRVVFRAGVGWDTPASAIAKATFSDPHDPFAEPAAAVRDPSKGLSCILVLMRSGVRCAALIAAGEWC